MEVRLGPCGLQAHGQTVFPADITTCVLEAVVPALIEASEGVFDLGGKGMVPIPECRKGCVGAGRLRSTRSSGGDDGRRE